MDRVQCDTFGQGRVPRCSKLESVVDGHHCEGDVDIQDLAFELAPCKLWTRVLGEDDVTAEGLSEKSCTIFVDDIIQVNSPN